MHRTQPNEVQQYQKNTVSIQIFRLLGPRMIQLDSFFLIPRCRSLQRQTIKPASNNHQSIVWAIQIFPVLNCD